MYRTTGTPDTASFGSHNHAGSPTAEWKPRERPSYVGLFHELPVKWGAPQGEEDDNSWFEEKLPSLVVCRMANGSSGQTSAIPATR